MNDTPNTPPAHPTFEELHASGLTDQEKRTHAQLRTRGLEAWAENQAGSPVQGVRVLAAEVKFALDVWKASEANASLLIEQLHQRIEQLEEELTSPKVKAATNADLRRMLRARRG